MDFGKAKNELKNLFNKVVHWGRVGAQVAKENPAVAIGVGVGGLLFLGTGTGLITSVVVGAGAGYFGGTKDGRQMLKLGYDRAKDAVNGAQKRLPPPGGPK